MLPRPRYDAIVIGTGFGGAVAACRLAQAGLSVGLLERGRRYPMGSFPRNFTDPTDGWLWDPGKGQLGLFDVNPVGQMQVVQSAGYGGGSLIYANVHLRPPAETFARGWPAGYTRATLDPYYDLVAYMLDVKPITESAHRPPPGRPPGDLAMALAVDGRPPKGRALEDAAIALGRGGQVCHPNLAVDFGPPGVARTNRFGVVQKGCVYCGECDIGCNHHAKNTLDLNYLAVAEQRGAEVGELCEAVRIDPAVAGGYHVAYRDHAALGAERAVEAGAVFLCAGAVNSTELLLRCRDVHRSLPALGGRLGDRYSGNGDFLAFVFNTDRPQEPWNGPTITTGVVVDRQVGTGAGAERVWYILEEGGHPPQVAALLQALNPRYDLLRDAGGPLHRGLGTWVAKTGRAVLGRAGVVGGDAAVFLVMGRDRSDGRVRLHPATGRPDIVWDPTPNLALYDHQEQVLADVARALGGDLALNPFWRFLRLPVSVHNLGGCVMADSPADGVTDGFGEVFNYPNLFVLDGGALPASTGVNPSSTIAAVAERNVERYVRRATGDTGWRAAEFAAAAATAAAQTPERRDPLVVVNIPPEGTPPGATPLVGLDFTETMRGFVQPGLLPPDYAAAERTAQDANNPAWFTATIAVTDLDGFLRDREHPAGLCGRVYVENFTDADGAPVSAGVFNLFVETDRPDARRMLYALPFLGKDGRPYLLEGFKDVRHRAGFDVWAATTTLYTVVREEHRADGPIRATGVLRLHLPDFAHQLTTIRVRGTDDDARRADAVARFGRMFMGTLWDLFAPGGTFAGGA